MSSASPTASASQGREPSPVTVGARLSCISSFFKFLIRMDVVRANPCDPRGATQASSRRTKRPLRIPRCNGSSRSSQTPSRVEETSPSFSLSSSPADADRRSSTSPLAMSPIDDSAVFYRYVGKGGLRGRRELPWSGPGSPIRRSLGDVDKDLASMQPSESLWQAGAGPQRRLQRHLLQPLPGLSGAWPVSLRPASMSYATPPPSSAATSASR